MPQNRQPPLTAAGAAGSVKPQKQQQQQKDAAADTADWQRGRGGFSGKAKKAYLRWKRERKAGTEDDPEAVAGGEDEDENAFESRLFPHAAAAAAASDKPAAAAAAGAGAAAAAAAPLRSNRHRAGQPPCDATAPLCYRELIDVPGDGDGEPSVVRLPRLDPAEAGFGETPVLGMPMRPEWQGVVSSPQELHALEEEQFAAWQQHLLQLAAGSAAESHQPLPSGGAAGADGAHNNNQQRQLPLPLPRPAPTPRAGGVGRLSFYEGRLEFWRQLWRTLEISDAVLLVVDARAPLLHLPHALCHHVMQQRHLPLLLLLNKCDLVPAAAAAAWTAWLQAALPGVTVLQVSAVRETEGAGGNDAAARRILAAVLDLAVRRGGMDVRVGDFIGMDVDKLVQSSLERNVHAKRNVVLEQPGGQEPGEDGDEGDDGDEDDDGSSEWWSLRPRGGGSCRRQRRRQRQPRQRGSAAAHRRGAPAHRGRAVGTSGSKGSGADSSSSSSTEQTPRLDANEVAAADLLEALTLERRLSATTSMNASTSSDAAAPWLSDARPVVLGLLGEPNVGKSSTLNALLGTHRVAVSCHPGRTKHYQTHFMSPRLVLCDCPGIVFPRLDVPLPMQVLFGSYPIASCRDPYAVVRCLAQSSWPRLQDVLGLESGPRSGSEWSPWTLCEALATKRRWVLPRSGRLDTYRAANWLLRAALGGGGQWHSAGVSVAFLPPEECISKR